MNAVKIIGAVVLLVGVLWVPVHSLVHAQVVLDKWHIILAAFIITIGATMLHERSMRFVGSFIAPLLPAKWRGKP